MAEFILGLTIMLSHSQVAELAEQDNSEMSINQYCEEVLMGFDIANENEETECLILEENFN